MSLPETAIAIPACGERDWLPNTLQDLAAQSDRHFTVWVCVNQPQSYYQDTQHQALTQNNLTTLSWLAQHGPELPFKLKVLDAVHPQKAPTDSQAGVGWARRQMFERITAHGNPLCISLDADTRVLPNYVKAVKETLKRYPNAVGLVIPYHHPTPSLASHALQLLRYEIYMRYYQLSLWRIGSPYAYLALGSAMAFWGQAYQRVGGMPARAAAEDFYYLQRLRKLGPLARYTATKVYPSARASDRVPFGTGPLMKELDLSLQEQRNPFYRQQAFDHLAECYAYFPKLYQQDVTIPATLPTMMRDEHVYAKMRRTLPTETHFVKACHERLDGLRTLQYLRADHCANGPTEPAEQVNKLLNSLGAEPVALSFDPRQLENLERVRDVLAQLEENYQKTFMAAWQPTAKW